MVFNIKFEVNIAPMMSFFGHFVYQMRGSEFRPTMVMRGLHGKLDLAVQMEKLSINGEPNKNRREPSLA